MHDGEDQPYPRRLIGRPGLLSVNMHVRRRRGETADEHTPSQLHDFGHFEIVKPRVAQASVFGPAGNFVKREHVYLLSSIAIEGIVNLGGRRDLGTSSPLFGP